jgi:ATP-dependent HslUV protease ATP-binding subunit HslU
MSLFSGQKEQQGPPSEEEQRQESQRSATRERLRQMLRDGKLDGREVEIEVSESVQAGIPLMGGGPGMDEIGMNLGEMLSGILPKKKKKTRTTVSEARKILQAEEAEKLVDQESVAQESLEKAQEEGIVFIDELDKVAATGTAQGGPDVSREGVQRDLLPVIEGCTVNTKYGPVQTDYILFIAAGAFQKAKPSDLIPELQGRIPLRVELNPLSEDDLARILVEPENSLIRQYQALLSTEEVSLEFSEDAVREMASLAARMNREMENIGARRLHTIMENLLEDLQFNAPEMRGETVVIDADFVRDRLEPLIADSDMRRYML